MGLFAGFIKDPGYQAVFCKAYNAWLAGGIVAESGGKVLGVGLLPTHDADEAAVELRRAKALGMVAVMFPADGTHLLGHRRFDGVYEAAAELDMAVAVHASGSTMAPGAEVFPKFIQAHSVAHPFGILRHFTSMMFEGVFERFPTVRFGFLETGATWVTLLASTGTLVCCALPIILVTFGMGATVAALTSTAPFLIILSQHKVWVFAGSAMMLALSGWMMYRPGRSCPVDP